MDIDLPYPVSENAMYLVIAGRGGRKAQKILSPEARTWRNKVLMMLKEKGIAKVSGPVVVTYTMQPPSHGKRIDVANAEKLTTDTLVIAGAIDDDTNIVRITLQWASWPVIPQGRGWLRATIEPYPLDTF